MPRGFIPQLGPCDEPLGLFQRDTQVLSELEERIEAKLANMYLKA